MWYIFFWTRFAFLQELFFGAPLPCLLFSCPFTRSVQFSSLRLLHSPFPCLFWHLLTRSLLGRRRQLLVVGAEKMVEKIDAALSALSVQVVWRSPAMSGVAWSLEVCSEGSRTCRQGGWKPVMLLNNFEKIYFMFVCFDALVQKLLKIIHSQPMSFHSYL